MKVIIAGSRNIIDYNVLRDFMEELNLKVSQVISGTALGVDKMGERWAKENYVKIKKMPADWNKYSKQAGILRNIEMAKNADALVALWDGKSRGTQHMIKIAKEMGLKVYVKKITG